MLTEPVLFDQDDDGTVIILVDRPGEALLDHARQAIYLCPSHALSLTPDDRHRER